MFGSLSVIAIAVRTGVFDPNRADPASVALIFDLGQVANILIVISAISVNLINVYSGGYSLANFSKKLKPKVSMILITALAFILALIPLLIGNFLQMFQAFLIYLGAIYPPCIAILVVDYYLLRRQKYDWTALAKKDGPYWYVNGVNWYAVICRLIGVVSYFISLRFSFVSASFGSVFFCFVVTAVLYCWNS